MFTSFDPKVPRILHHLLDHQLRWLLNLKMLLLVLLPLFLFIEKVKIINHDGLRDLIELEPVPRIISLSRILMIITLYHTVIESFIKAFFVFKEC